MTATISEIIATDVPPAVAQILTLVGANSISAAGSAQGDATALTADLNIVTTTALSSGVRLPATKNTTNGQSKHLIMVSNRGANTLSVYPATGESINALAANTAISVTAGSGRIFWTTGNGVWVG